MTVRRVAAEGHEEVPGLYLPGVITDLGNFRFQIRVGGEELQPRQQFLELHTCKTSIQSNTFWMIITQIKRIVYGVFCQKPGKTCSQSRTELSPKRTVTTVPGGSSVPSPRS